jgi:CRISPR-associated protein Csd2
MSSEMSHTVINDANRRHDFVLLFDVTDGNPNGDPDAGNMPRMDPLTGEGLVSDVAIKRKIRDYVDVAYGTEERYKIYVQHGTYLTDTRARVFADRGGKSVSPSEARQWMCAEFYDVRMFGAVMSMKQHNAGQVRGPLQITFARSCDQIRQVDVQIARVALERGERAQTADDEELTEATHGTFGRKALVPYGLYRAHGFFNPHFARQTGVTEEDLARFWQALQHMWDVDRSAARGMLACRGLYVFSHASSLGNAPAHTLFERMQIARDADVPAPRSFQDYTVTVNTTDLPDDITLTTLVGA